MIKKFICIHGHFYQPPRENPWLDRIEVQSSAKPYNDWNERVSAECYGPNGYSRILNEKNKIVQIQNNYSYISFNIGPTLLSWLKRHAFSVYESILHADRVSIDLNNGHGNALAQVYNHSILPLCDTEDKNIQVKWGISDFKSHFNRYPEGMWLAETAVNTETLEVLAEHDIKFTILSPFQANRIRPLGSKVAWTDATNANIDTTKPYLVNLPSGRTITVFFYDNILSQAVAFEHLLVDGKNFSDRLVQRLNMSETNKPQLVNIATDGETYGHHHKLGNMGLAYCIKTLSGRSDLELTNYGNFLSMFPPQFEVKITENTAWSCSHGLGRWERDCGCNSGGHPGWNQKWRTPLRMSLNTLRDMVKPYIHQTLALYVHDVDKAKADYINLILDRSEESKVHFIKVHTKYPILEIQERSLLRALEMFRNLQLMYTSCGWFFDDISGIEVGQILTYTDRVLQLYEQLTGSYLDNTFLDQLEAAVSNIPAMENGKSFFTRFIRPKRLNFQRVLMHAAIKSIFTVNVENDLNYGNYSLKIKYRDIYEAGFSKLTIGQCAIQSTITGYVRNLSYIVIYIGQSYFAGCISDFLDDNQITDPLVQEKITEIITNFKNLEVVKSILLIDRLDSEVKFAKFDFMSLSRDHQNEIFNILIEEDLKFALYSAEQIFLKNYSTLNLMNMLSIEPPTILKRNINLVINSRIIDFLKGDDDEFSKFEQMVVDANRWHVDLLVDDIAVFAAKKIYFMVKRIESKLDFNAENELLKHAIQMLQLLFNLKVHLHLWESQNVFFNLIISLQESLKTEPRPLTITFKHNVEKFYELGNLLNIDFTLDI